MKRKETVYQRCIIVLLLLFTVFVMCSHKNYMDLLEVNESYKSLIDKQREEEDEIIKKWVDDYHNLQTQYNQLLIRNGGEVK